MLRAGSHVHVSTTGGAGRKHSTHTQVQEGDGGGVTDVIVSTLLQQRLAVRVQHLHSRLKEGRIEREMIRKRELWSTDRLTGTAQETQVHAGTCRHMTTLHFQTKRQDRYTRYDKTDTQHLPFVS